jgi:hypothetical protein
MGQPPDIPWGMGRYIQVPFDELPGGPIPLRTTFERENYARARARLRRCCNNYKRKRVWPLLFPLVQNKEEPFY